jgi:hypothetical protein
MWRKQHGDDTVLDQLQPHTPPVPAFQKQSSKSSQFFVKPLCNSLSFNRGEHSHLHVTACLLLVSDSQLYACFFILVVWKCATLFKSQLFLIKYHHTCEALHVHDYTLFSLKVFFGGSLWISEPANWASSSSFQCFVGFKCLLEELNHEQWFRIKVWVMVLKWFTIWQCSSERACHAMLSFWAQILGCIQLRANACLVSHIGLGP